MSIRGKQFIRRKVKQHEDLLCDKRYKGHKELRNVKEERFKDRARDLEVEINESLPAGNFQE